MPTTILAVGGVPCFGACLVLRKQVCEFSGLHEPQCQKTHHAKLGAIEKNR